MILDILIQNDYSLCLSPGFYCFYAELGVVHALEELNALRPKFISGSSAGAIIGSFLACGRLPSELLSIVMSIKRDDLIDFGGIGGLIKGQLLQEYLETHLPCKNIEDCPIPLGLTAWDLVGFRTNILTSGCLATAIRASACFPLLFAPVMIDGRPYIDGGVFDTVGMMALPGVPDDDLVVNVVNGRSQIYSSVPPAKFPNAKLLTIVLDNIPSVNPLTIETSGPLAYRYARIAMHRALESGHVMQLDHHHWVLYADGAVVNPLDDFLLHTVHPHHVAVDASALGASSFSPTPAPCHIFSLLNPSASERSSVVDTSQLSVPYRFQLPSPRSPRSTTSDSSPKRTWSDTSLSMSRSGSATTLSSLRATAAAATATATATATECAETATEGTSAAAPMVEDNTAGVSVPLSVADDTAAASGVPEPELPAKPAARRKSVVVKKTPTKAKASSDLSTPGPSVVASEATDRDEDPPVGPPSTRSGLRTRSQVKATKPTAAAVLQADEADVEMKPKRGRKSLGAHAN